MFYWNLYTFRSIPFITIDRYLLLLSPYYCPLFRSFLSISFPFFSFLFHNVRGLRVTASSSTKKGKGSSFPPSYPHHSLVSHRHTLGLLISLPPIASLHRIILTQLSLICPFSPFWFFSLSALTRSSTVIDCDLPLSPSVEADNPDYRPWRHLSRNIGQC